MKEVKLKSSGNFAVDASQLAIGATLAQLIGILLAPIFSRIFSPEAFGTVAVFTSILQIIGVIVCLRYEIAIMLPQKDEDAISLLVGCLLITSVFSGITALIVLFLSTPIVTWLNAPELKSYIWMLPIAVLAMGSSLSLGYWVSRNKHFKWISGVNVVSSVSKNITQLGAGMLGYVGAGSLIFAQTVFSITSALGLIYKTWRDDRNIILQSSWEKILDQFNRYRKFPIVSTWSGLLNTISIQLPTILLSRYFTQTIVGYYSFGSRVIQIPMILVGDAIAQVFFQRAAIIHHEGKLYQLVQNTYQRLVKIGLFPILILGLIGEEIFILVFGLEWAEAGVYTQILSLWRFFVFIGSPMSKLFSVLERQEAGLAFNIILLISRALTLVIGGLMGDARLALIFYAGSGVIIWIFLIIWLFQVSGASIMIAIRDTGSCLLFATPTIVMLIAAKWWWHWSSFNLILLAVFGSIIYYGIIIWQDSTLLSMVKGIWNRM